MKKRLVISDELTLAYVDYGAGKPVIFHTGLDLHHESLREKPAGLRRALPGPGL